MEDIEFNEDETIRYILKNMTTNNDNKIKEEQIQLVLDFIYDYYEESGLLEGDNDDEIAINEDELFSFIANKLDEENCEITEEQLTEILELEYKFGQKNGIFE